MPDIQQILFATTGDIDDSSTAARAFHLCKRYDARLTVLLVCPPLPETLSSYGGPYLSGLRSQLDLRLRAASDTAGISIEELKPEIVLELTLNPVLTILDYARKAGCSLLVKQADPTENELGFKARDMTLLRKSSCPTWLHRGGGGSRDPLRVAVAIDPEPLEDKANDLAIQLLRWAKELASPDGSTLQIVSCWDYPFENYLRRNAWVAVEDEVVTSTVQAVRSKHLTALKTLIKKSGITIPYRMEHLRGSPSELLPDFVTRHQIEVLVMGTLGRTGLAGFLMGNTSEDVARRLGCSLLALKPSYQLP